MDLADALHDTPAPSPNRLAQARDRLASPARSRASAWPTFAAAALAATAALGAAAAVILGAPGLGAASGKVLPAVTHVIGS